MSKNETLRPTLNSASAPAVITSMLMAANAPLLLGPAGVGKTQLITQIMKTLPSPRKIKLITITGGQLPSVAYVTGIPAVSGTSTITTTPQWYVDAKRAFEDGLQPMVFIDELPNAAPDVSAALLQLLNEGRVGAFDLNPFLDPLSPFTKIPTIAAGNAPEHLPSTYHMSAPMGNRLAIFEYTGPTPKAFVDWGRSTGRLHPAVQNLFTAGEEGSLADPRAALLDYGDRARIINPSPRSWEAVSRLIAYWDTLPKAPNPTARVVAISSLIPRKLATETQTALLIGDSMPPTAEVFAFPTKVDVPKTSSLRLFQAQRLIQALSQDFTSSAVPTAGATEENFLEDLLGDLSTTPTTDRAGAIATYLCRDEHTRAERATVLSIVSSATRLSSKARRTLQKALSGAAVELLTS